MAWPTVATPANANRIVGVIEAAYVRPSGGLYQTLGAIRDTEFILEDYSQVNSRKKNKSTQAKSVSAKLTMMQCSLIELELLDTLIDGTNSFLFKMADAGAIPGAAAVTAGWFLFSSSQIGVNIAKIDLSGDVSKNANIQLEFSGSLQDAAIDAAIKASIDDDEFEATGGSGTFKAIGTYTAAKDGGLATEANIKSCGIASLTIADTGGAAQTLGPIDDPVIEFVGVAEKDSLNIFRTRWFDTNITYKWKQTDSANLLNLDTFSNAAIDKVITMANGLVITLVNKVGIASRFESLGDFENTRSIVFKHTGSLLPSELDGIFS